MPELMMVPFAGRPSPFGSGALRQSWGFHGTPAESPDRMGQAAAPSAPAAAPAAAPVPVKTQPPETNWTLPILVGGGAIAIAVLVTLLAGGK